jgi:hypothetical protein
VLAATLAEDVRSAAVGAVDGIPGPSTEGVLVMLTTHAPLPFSADAALRLGERNMPKYRELLTRVAAEWPEEAGYPVTGVRTLLEAPDDSP